MLITIQSLKEREEPPPSPHQRCQPVRIAIYRQRDLAKKGGPVLEELLLRERRKCKGSGFSKW